MRTLSLFTALILVFTSCGPKKQEKPLVVVSIPPYVEMVEAIAGDLVDVEAFLDADDNPHLFEPTARQMSALDNAQLFIGIGEPFEQKIQQYLAKSPTLILNLGEGVGDRHIWMSLRLAQNQAQDISAAITKLLPQTDKMTVAKNTDLYIQKLQTLDQALTRKLAPFDRDAILVSHPSFAYYCQDYNLVQISVERSGKDPLPAQIDEILKSKTPFRCALIVPHSQAKGTRLIADKLGIPVHTFNPLDEDYLENIEHLTNLIVK